MKLSKKIVLLVMIAVAAAFALSFALPISLCPWNRLFIYVATRQANQMRVRLLYETDHAALLAACRKLSTQVATGKLKPGRYWVRTDRDPEASRFPQPILDLAPSYVYVDENMTGRVMLEMLGGLGHFGVEAYSEDFKAPFKGFEYGHKELIPGMWYYDDGYDDNPEYDKHIDALLQQRKQ